MYLWGACQQQKSPVRIDIATKPGQTPWQLLQHNSRRRRGNVGSFSPFSGIAANHQSAVNWADARRRVLTSYREWIRAVSCLDDLPRPNRNMRHSAVLVEAYSIPFVFFQAPEVQTMYSVPFPVAAIRTRMRQEFERHRYVNKLNVVDMLIFQSHADYQVRLFTTN